MAHSRVRTRRQEKQHLEAAEPPKSVEIQTQHKRARSSSVQAADARDSKRQRTRSPQESQPAAPKRVVQRPGVPPPTRLSAFVVPDRPSPPLRDPDKDGHYMFELGENLSTRYKILSKMGEGTFGRVLECWDRKNKDYVAIKIVRNVKKYRDAAMIELEVLATLEQNDLDGQWHCVSLREWFDYRGHVCMVFEKLGLSLYDFLRKNNYRPFHLDYVRDFGRQLLETVAYLHDLALIHTDLKPENILLQSSEYLKQTPPPSSKLGRRIPSSSDIKVIDFGSATFDDQYHSTIVSTRHYRAPEVILGLGWTFPCDLWSMGCILVELVTGDALFQTHENLEHLAMMEAVLGPIPEHLARQANRQAAKGGKDRQAAKYFTHRHKLNWPEGAQNRKSVRAVQKLTALKPLLLEMCDTSIKPHIEPLVDLLERMLRYDPSERITAVEALRHEFFHPLTNGASPPT